MSWEPTKWVCKVRVIVQRLCASRLRHPAIDIPLAWTYMSWDMHFEVDTMLRRVNLMDDDAGSLWFRGLVRRCEPHACCPFRSVTIEQLLPTRIGVGDKVCWQGVTTETIRRPEQNWR